MERTLDRLSDHTGATAGLIADTVAKMRTHMRAIRIQNFRGAAFSAKNNELLVETTQGLGLTNRQLVGVKDLKPPPRHGQRASRRGIAGNHHELFSCFRL
jgi:hypothetical protein